MGRIHKNGEYRRCNSIRHVGNRYLPTSMFHKQGFRNGKRQYSTYCRDCTNAINRDKYAEGNKPGGNQWEYKASYLRARSRALTRLKGMYPEMFDMILQEELEKEPEWQTRKTRSRTSKR